MIDIPVPATRKQLALVAAAALILAAGRAAGQETTASDDTVSPAGPRAGEAGEPADAGSARDVTAPVDDRVPPTMRLVVDPDDDPPEESETQPTTEIAPGEGLLDEREAPTPGDIAPGDGRLDRLDESVEELQRRGQIAAALETAEEVVDEVEERLGVDMALVEPLLTVVDLQLQLPDRAAAERTLTRIVSIVERKDSVFSMHLVEPLTILADIYSATNRREDAITALRRARHITHRNLGVLNMDQIELADRLAENYYSLGRIGEANRENRFAFRVSKNEYGEDSASLVPALGKLAGWYERIGEFSVSRRLYKRSIELVERDHGEEDLRLVDLLQRLAGTYRRQNLYKGEGKKALERAVEIHNAHPEADIIERARSLTDLGDWLMVTAQRGKAMKIYRQAWDLLTADGASPERANILFGRPKRLRYTPPLPDPGLMVGRSEIFVDVEFQVTPEGNVTDLSVADSSAHWRIQNDVRVAMRHARFRPMFVDGEPARAPMRYRWTYRIPESRRAESSREAAAEALPDGDAD